MTTRHIEVHGCRFAIEGDGFARNHADADLDRGADRVAEILIEMPESHVQALHHVAWDWADRGCIGERPTDLDRLEVAAHAAATEGWHNPGAVTVSVSAVI